MHQQLLMKPRLVAMLSRCNWSEWIHRIVALHEQLLHRLSQVPVLLITRCLGPGPWVSAIGAAYRQTILLNEVKRAEALLHESVSGFFGCCLFQRSLIGMPYTYIGGQ